MNKDVVYNLRLDTDTKESVDECSKEMGITSSEFIRNAIDYYLEEKPFEFPSVEQIQDMNWDELTEVIDELGLEIDPNEYDNSGFLSSPDADDTEELREAVLTELGLLDEVSAEMEAEEFE